MVVFFLFERDPDQRIMVGLYRRKARHGIGAPKIPKETYKLMLR